MSDSPTRATPPTMLDALKFASEILHDQAERFHKDCRCQLCESCVPMVDAALAKAALPSPPPQPELCTCGTPHTCGANSYESAVCTHCFRAVTLPGVPSPPQPLPPKLGVCDLGPEPHIANHYCVDWRETEHMAQFGGPIRPKFKLLKPIPVEVERAEGCVSVWSEDLKDFGSGASLGAAMEDFGKSICALWEIFREEDLGPELKLCKEKLDSFLVLREAEPLAAKEADPRQAWLAEPSFDRDITSLEEIFVRGWNAALREAALPLAPQRKEK